MKKQLLTPLLCLCLAGALTLTAGAHWGQPVLDEFSGSGYLEGYENSLPDDAMTQAQFAAVFSRVAGLKGGNAIPSANTVLTRQDAAVLLAGALELDGSADTAVLDRFTDSGEISASARASVAAVVAAGYMNGTDASVLQPAKSLTWAEGVTLLRNAADALRALAEEALEETETSDETPAADASDVVYGTATLTYAEYYSGDVSSTDGYGIDGVTSATVEKHVSFNNGMYTNYTEDKTDGYNILGVKNVNVAVAAADYEAYLDINPTFEKSETAPKQYKTVTIEDGKAVYSATAFNVADTVTDATANLKTGSTWGDYEIDIVENSTQYIRNNRSDEGWVINAYVQGVILETSDGMKVGMEYLQSMWVQPWEVSFNVSADSERNGHIAGWDNLNELAKLVGKTITSVTYLMPDSTYIYKFGDGIYIKPAYSGDEAVSATLTAGSAEVTISGIPDALENVTATITYGSGRNSTTVADAAPVVGGTVTMTEACDSEQTYSVRISSSNYADIVAAVPMSGTQLTQLTGLLEAAKALIEDGTAANDSGLIEHYEEAEEILASGSATTAEAADLISELTGHLSVYVAQEEPAESGHGGH